MKNASLKNPQSILITGASSGIGAALARYYAAAGRTLFLSGRDETRLAAVAQAAQERGAAVHYRVLDVRDRAAVTAWVRDCDDVRALDLVIANAGISGGTGGVIVGEPASQAQAIFDVNVNGVLYTLGAAQDRMVARGRGQMAVMSSLASFAAWPGAPAYSASKAAVRLYAEALHGALRGTGVSVCAICPGFIKTPMTAVNGYFMPFLMDVDRAAQRIARGLAAGRVRLAFPFVVYFFAALPSFLPPFFARALLQRMPSKPSSN